MKKQMGDTPYDSLQKLFHEPHRLAIMSTLCATGQGLSFTELRKECGLTDGNLSRHLKTMEDAQVIRVEKAFVARKPRTMVYTSDVGHDSFLEYLTALEEVLNRAVSAVQSYEENTAGAVSLSSLQPV